MAIKAQAQITLTAVVDVQSIWWYYRLQASDALPPAVPTKNPPDGWNLTEPAYTPGSSSTLYFVELTVYSDSSFSYSAVSVDSTYEAAKAAYIKANAAHETAQEAADAAAEQAGTLADTAGAVTSLQDTVASNSDALASQGEKLNDHQHEIDSNANAIANQAEDLSGIKTRLAVTEEGLALVHQTADNVNHYMSFDDGLVIGRSDQDTYSRYDSDGMTVVSKHVDVATFGSAGAFAPNLTVNKTLRIGDLIAVHSDTDGIFLDWADS